MCALYVEQNKQWESSMKESIENDSEINLAQRLLKALATHGSKVAQVYKI